MTCVLSFSLMGLPVALLLSIATSTSGSGTQESQAAVLPPVDPVFDSGLAVLRKSTGIIEGLPEGNQFEWMPSLQLLMEVFASLAGSVPVDCAIAVLRALIEIIISSPRLQFVVPFAVELIGTELQFKHLRPGDFHAGLVRA